VFEILYQIILRYVAQVLYTSWCSLQTKKIHCQLMDGKICCPPPSYTLTIKRVDVVGTLAIFDEVGIASSPILQ
jgi:hypothetical protein